MTSKRSARRFLIYLCMFSVVGPVLFESWHTKSFAQTADQIVDQFYPANLIQESDENFAGGGPAPFRASAFVVADLNGSGQSDFIVAAYTNGFSATIRVLQRQGTGYVLVQEPTYSWMVGIFPTVELRDLDGDKKPEIVASFSSPQGAAVNWIFRWNSGSLELISPSPLETSDDLYIALVNVFFDDLDRDGKLEAISVRKVGDENQVDYDVFGFDNSGTLQFRNSAKFYRTYYRAAGAPNLTTETFTVEGSNLAYRVKILNGDSQGQDRVSSGEVSLNGVIIFTPQQLNQQVSQITVPVTLQQSNILTVDLRSAVGRQLTVLVEPQ